MSRGQVISNVTQTFKDNAEYTITPPQGFEAMEKATIIVDVEQPLVQNNKSQTITNPSETVTINPDEGYDALKKVTVTTNVPIYPNRTIQSYYNSSYYPSTNTEFNGHFSVNVPEGYEGQKDVSVGTKLIYKSITSNGSYSIVDNRTYGSEIGFWKVDVNIPLETWTNKRFISTGTINVGNVMNDNTKAGISKESTFVIDVPTPSITQISNYPVTTTGTVNVPIPSGYDAVDSISLSVNVSSKIIIDGFEIDDRIKGFVNMTKGSNSSVSMSEGCLLRIEDVDNTNYKIYIRILNGNQNIYVNNKTYYYIEPYTSNNDCTLCSNINKVIKFLDNVYDNKDSIFFLNKNYFEIQGLPS